MSQSEFQKQLIVRLKQRSQSGAGNDTEQRQSHFCSILGPLGLGLSSDIREGIHFVKPAIKRQLKGEKLRSNY